MAAGVPALLVVGELCVDIVVQLADEIEFGQFERIVPATTVTLGSSSAITACGAARLGLRTELIGVRGNDLFGRYISDELSRLGVSDRHSLIDTRVPTGSSTHLTKPDGDRAILTALGSIGAVTADDVPEDLLASADHLHVGSYFLQSALWRDAAALFERARSRGLTTSVDPNFDPTERWDSGILALLPRVDVLFCNEQEALGMTGAGSVPSAVTVLLGHLPLGAHLVLKQGAAGATLATRTGAATSLWRIAPPPLPRPIADTVGAGDSLAAGFLAARIRGLDPVQSLRVGVAAGTASTGGAGGTSAQSTWEEASRLASQTAASEIATG